MTKQEKKKLFDLLLATLREDLESAIGASKDAAAYATDEEARAESKYDTQGLEASYLAAGQAGQAQEAAEAINRLGGDRALLTSSSSKVESGAVFQLQFGDDKTDTEWFYLATAGGGEELEIGGQTISVVTPSSPLVISLKDAEKGDMAKLANGSEVTVLEIS